MTYHISLKYFLSQPDPNARQARWMAFLSEFEFDMKHIKGKENKIADAFSRHEHILMEIFISSVSTNSME